MTWEIVDIMSARWKFVVRAISPGANKSALCREFSISRPTGEKWIERFLAKGYHGLSDQSRAPKNIKQQTDINTVCTIVRLRQSHPSWGGRKIRSALIRQGIISPSARTIDRILQKSALVTIKRYRRRKKPNREFTDIAPEKPNHIWTIDIKGWWRMLSGEKVYPITICDLYSRTILAIAMAPDTKAVRIKDLFTELFELHGLPEYIKSDNGTPWAFRPGLCGLTSLSVWWMSLGITPLFIPPASPQFNASHERMHKDMADELQSCPALNLQLEQQRADMFRIDYNTIRSHDALGGKVPSDLYKSSRISFSSDPINYSYPKNFHLRRILSTGKVNWRNKTHFISKAFANQTIAFEIINGKKMNIWFQEFCIGYSDSNISTPLVEYSLINHQKLATRKRLVNV